MSTRFFNPIFQALDDAGVARTDGTLTFFAQGTTTKLDTFQDSALTIPNSNPVITTKGARMPDIWLQDQNYTVLFEIGGKEVWTADISGSAVAVATETSAGIVRLATAQEMQSGTATDAVPTVATVTSGIQLDAAQVISGILNAARLPAGSETAKGAVELATQTEMDQGASNVVPPADKVKTFVDAAIATAIAGVGGPNTPTNPGSIELDNGLKIQWGSNSVGGNSSLTISYPIAFTTFAIPVASGAASGGSNDPGPGVVSTTLTNFVVHNSAGSTITAFWIAIGV